MTPAKTILILNACLLQTPRFPSSCEHGDAFALTSGPWQNPCIVSQCLNSSSSSPLFLCKFKPGVLPWVSSLCLDWLDSGGRVGGLDDGGQGDLFTCAAIKTRSGLAQLFYSPFYLPPVNFGRRPPFLLLLLVILPVPRLRRG